MESGQRLEHVNQTHPVLVSGKLVQQKKLISEFILVKILVSPEGKSVKAEDDFLAVSVAFVEIVNPEQLVTDRVVRKPKFEISGSERSDDSFESRLRRPDDPVRNRIPVIRFPVEPIR